MAVTLSPDEVSRRAPVWAAMSELFLDTKLSEQELSAITASIKQAGYSAEEAEEILIHEVAPVFSANLLDFAGEWLPWDEDEVVDLILAKLAKTRQSTTMTAPRRWFRRRMILQVRPDWQQVKRGLKS